jgi:cysteine desulfurase/selenocysteine lyase
MGEMVREVHLDYSTWNDLPYKFEAGTMNIDQAIGLASAVDYLDNLGMEEVREHEKRLGGYTYRRLSGRLVLAAGRASARPRSAFG